MSGERSILADFYRCPSTGELVYRWSEERLVLVTSDEVRTLRLMERDST